MLKRSTRSRRRGGRPPPVHQRDAKRTRDARACRRLVPQRNGQRDAGGDRCCPRPADCGPDPGTASGWRPRQPRGICVQSVVSASTRGLSRCGTCASTRRAMTLARPRGSMRRPVSSTSALPEPTILRITHVRPRPGRTQLAAGWLRRPEGRSRCRQPTQPTMHASSARVGGKSAGGRDSPWDLCGGQRRLRDSPERWQEFDADPHDFIDAGEHVIVLGHSRGRPTDDGGARSTRPSRMSGRCATARPSTSRPTWTR